MQRRQPSEADLASFVPRITLTLVGALALFAAASFLYAVLPVWLETPPAGAIPDYMRERVMARMEGKVLLLFAASLLASAALVIRLTASSRPGRSSR